MKKFLSTLAIAGVATLALASCGGTNDPATKTGATGTGTPTTTTGGGNNTTTGSPSGDLYEGKLTVWCSTSDGVAELFKEKGDAWLAANGYTGVTLEVTPVGEGDAVGKVMEDVEVAADVYCFAQDQLARAVTGGAIAKVPNLFLDDVKTRNSEGGLISGTVGDTLYAYPLTNDNGYIMMYDKSVMEGVDMTDMSAIIAKCNETDTNFSFNLGNIWYSAGFFFAQDEEGNRLCSSSWGTDSNGKFISMIDTFKSDNGLIAVKGMYELASADCFYDSAEATDFGAATPSSVVVVGSWGAAAARDALGEDFAATVLPKFTVDGHKYQLGSFSGSKLIGVKPQTDVKKARLAHSMANYLSGEEVQTALFETQGWGGTNLNLQATDAYKEDVVLSSLGQQANFAIPQGQILGAWWTIGNAINTNIKDTDGSDAALMEALTTYDTDLRAAFNLQGDALFVGAHNGWNNADATMIMQETSDGVYTITITFAEDLAYKGGRIVKPASWDTLAGYTDVAADSLSFLDAAYNPDGGSEANGDNNLVFAAAGTYTITYDSIDGTITITAA
jgi:arabinogalactan oligomer/maltooligosaccharide transport system substrate-binding protein